MEYENRWNLRSKPTLNFHPSSPRQDDSPPVFPPLVWNMPISDVYNIIKKLASFMSRNNITGDRVRHVARALYDELSAQKNHHLEESYGTLKVLAGMPHDIKNAYASGNLYDYLYQFINISINDKETGNPRHKCDRRQCELYCILPIFANRCMSDSKVMALLQSLKAVLAENPKLISGDVAETVQKLLKFVAYLGDDSLKDSYDVLFAMSGHSGTILDSAAFVDSLLYELLFDHLLLYYPDTWSFRPWMESAASTRLSDDVRNLMGEEPQRSSGSAGAGSVRGASSSGATGGSTGAEAPPSYDSVASAPKQSDDDYQLPTYEEAVIDKALKIGKQTTV